jgi:hypothetical protein
MNINIGSDTLQRKITVRGNGKLEVQPDFIKVYVNLEETNKDYKRAVASLNENAKTIVKCVTDSGLSKDNITTDDYFVNTKTRREKTLTGSFKQVFDCYVAKQKIVISFEKDIELLGKIIVFITQSLSEPDFSVDFTLKNVESVSQRLIENMAKDAYNKAKILCESAQAQIGKLLSVDYKWNDISSFKPVGETTVLEDMTPFLAAEPIPAQPMFKPKSIRLEESAIFVWEIE